MGNDLIRLATVDGKRCRCIAHWKTIDMLPGFERRTRNEIDKEKKKISTILQPHFERKIKQEFAPATGRAEIYLTPDDLTEA